MKAGGAINCLDATTRNLVRDGLKNKLEAIGSMRCTTSLNCKFEDFSCSYDTVASSVTLKFTLNQIANLMDKDILDGDVEKIKASAVANNIAFEINTARKRAVIPMSEIVVKKAETKTACPAKSITINDECSVCSPGYGLNSAKDACVICNFGSWSTGGYMSCNPCVSSTLTTQLMGATNALSCIPKTDICVVGGIISLNGNLFPPTGSRVMQSTIITGVCPSGTNQEFGVSDRFSCNQEKYPICHGKYFN